MADFLDPDELMRLAIEVCRRGIDAGQTPFGCAIWIDGEVVAEEHNRVVADTDITAHAEIVALRQACQSLGRIQLKRAIVASTCEPCPMCMTALHWARVDVVHYGATIVDATAAGFNELGIPAARLVHDGGSPVRIVPETLADECRGLFKRWQQIADRVTY